MQAVLVAPTAAGVQAEVLPALSRDRNCTLYVPVVVNVTEAPDWVAPQVRPPSRETRYS
jgi:hypothetical protein